MNKEEVIKLAREAGGIDMTREAGGNSWTSWVGTQSTEFLERFADLVAAHKTEVAIAEAYRCGHEAGMVEEREECAKLVEHFDGYSPRYGNHLTNCAAAIRNRGKE